MWDRRSREREGELEKCGEGGGGVVEMTNLALRG